MFKCKMFPFIMRALIFRALSHARYFPLFSVFRSFTHSACVQFDQRHDVRRESSPHQKHACPRLRGHCWEQVRAPKRSCRIALRTSESKLEALILIDTAERCFKHTGTVFFPSYSWSNFSDLYRILLLMCRSLLTRNPISSLSCSCLTAVQICHATLHTGIP